MRSLSQALSVLALAAVLTASPAQAAESPRVVASIAPLGSLAAAVMRGVAEPTVLLPAGASPHAYALRPSEARALASADLVLWIGEALETFLEEPLAALARPGAVVELIDTEGLILHPTRTGGIWESDHGHAREAPQGSAHAHDHGSTDAHLWLDPRNAAILVDRIASALAERDPDRAAAYRNNADAAKAELNALDTELAAALSAIGDRPYVVFHDAYQYLEQRYDLFPIGAVTVGPERGPGAQRLSRLRDEIAGRGATCAFREPQFTPKVLESLASDTQIRIGVLDPLGTDTKPGPDGYPRLMRALAASLTGCLAAGD
ncbi:periplasmic solute binding protein [alpha proteobacterium BAL199]|jgi:zinc transport system substrate-binding protein|nr:periplasmic solute binding protein [alpha proteobacterium BAL199]